MGGLRGLRLGDACCGLCLRYCVRDQLLLLVSLANRDDDELSARRHVGHETAAGCFVELELRDELPGGLVKGAENTYVRSNRTRFVQLAAFVVTRRASGLEDEEKGLRHKGPPRHQPGKGPGAERR